MSFIYFEKAKCDRNPNSIGPIPMPFTRSIDSRFIFLCQCRLFDPIECLKVHDKLTKLG